MRLWMFPTLELMVSALVVVNHGFETLSASSYCGVVPTIVDIRLFIPLSGAFITEISFAFSFILGLAVASNFLPSANNLSV